MQSNGFVLNTMVSKTERPAEWEFLMGLWQGSVGFGQDTVGLQQQALNPKPYKP